jgi:hypothetical protein
VPFTLRNLREDLEDLGANFDGSPDLEILVFGAPGLGGASLNCQTKQRKWPARIGWFRRTVPSPYGPS